jgi:hypothetical protein
VKFVSATRSTSLRERSEFLIQTNRAARVGKHAKRLGEDNRLLKRAGSSAGLGLEGGEELLAIFNGTVDSSEVAEGSETAVDVVENGVV